MHTNFKVIIFYCEMHPAKSVCTGCEKSEQLSCHRPYLPLSLQEMADRKQDEVSKKNKKKTCIPPSAAPVAEHLHLQ